jgi:hypothetical protein
MERLVGEENESRREHLGSLNVRPGWSQPARDLETSAPNGLVTSVPFLTRHSTPEDP